MIRIGYSDGAEVVGVALWCSYVGRGAPSNAAGSRIGYGRSRQEASEAAAHWHNQAPWERFRRVRFLDQGSADVVSPEEQHAVMRVLPDEACLEFCSAEDREAARRAWDLAREGKTASAMLAWLDRKER